MGERAAFGPFVVKAGRDFLAEVRPALLFAPAVNNVIDIREPVNCKIHHYLGEHVDYKEATDRLFGRITATDLADELGVSQNAVARARLDPTTRDFRPPPAGWRTAVARLAGERAEELLKLKAEIEQQN